MRQLQIQLQGTKKKGKERKGLGGLREENLRAKNLTF